MDLFVYDLTWIGSAVMLLMIGLLRPVASAAHSSFTAHMLGHLLLGMIAPLMLVHSAPVTLALRALPVQAARVLSRVLRSPGARVLTHPVVAGMLNAGGLWLIYATDLFQVMHVSRWRTRWSSCTSWWSATCSRRRSSGSIRIHIGHRWRCD